MIEEDTKVVPQNNKNNNVKLKRKLQNASSLAFGWIFQSSAGLYLFDCIENSISLRMEG